MNLIDKFNAFLAKFVGPNAAHMIDGLIGVGLVAGAGLVYSAPARLFLSHHSKLAVVVGLAIPVVTALASKFRKAAGSSASLVDELTSGVLAAIGTRPSDPRPPAVVTIGDVSHLINAPGDIAKVASAVAIANAQTATLETPAQ